MKGQIYFFEFHISFPTPFIQVLFLKADKKVLYGKEEGGWGFKCERKMYPIGIYGNMKAIKKLSNTVCFITSAFF